MDVGIEKTKQSVRIAANKELYGDSDIPIRLEDPFETLLIQYSCDLISVWAEAKFPILPDECERRRWAVDVVGILGVKSVGREKPR